MVDKDGGGPTMVGNKKKIKWSFCEDIKECLPCLSDKKNREFLKVRKEIMKSAKKKNEK